MPRELGTRSRWPALRYPGPGGMWLGARLHVGILVWADVGNTISGMPHSDSETPETWRGRGVPLRVQEMRED